MNSEAAFLFSTFQEFYKCWIFSTRTCGDANVDFSAFLGHQDDVHFKLRHTKSKRNGIIQEGRRSQKMK